MFILQVTSIFTPISKRALLIPYSVKLLLIPLVTSPIKCNLTGILGPKLDKKDIFVIAPKGISYIIPSFNLSES